MGLTLRRPCACGHDKAAHGRERRATDCGACRCEGYDGQLELTLRLGRPRQLGTVVLPDEAYVPEGPWVRPTHSAGLTPAPPLPAYVAAPRTPFEGTVPEPVARA